MRSSPPVPFRADSGRRGWRTGCSSSRSPRSHSTLLLFPTVAFPPPMADRRVGTGRGDERRSSPRCCGPPTSRSRRGLHVATPSARRARRGPASPPWRASSPSFAALAASSRVRPPVPPVTWRGAAADPVARVRRHGHACSSSSSRSRGTPGYRRARDDHRRSHLAAFILSLGWGSRWRRPSPSLKYRLYDLDLVVKKTAVFTIVALFLTGLYLLGLGLAALSGLGAILAVDPVRADVQTPCGTGRARWRTGSCTASARRRSRC